MEIEGQIMVLETVKIFCGQNYAIFFHSFEKKKNKLVEDERIKPFSENRQKLFSRKCTKFTHYGNTSKCKIG